MSIKTEPFGQNIAEAIKGLQIDSLRVTGLARESAVIDSAYGFARTLSAYGKTEQSGIPSPTAPQEIKHWSGRITSRYAEGSASSVVDLGFKLYGIKVDDGGNYTDAEGQMWLCDYINIPEQKIVRRIGAETITSDGNWFQSTTFIGSYQIRGWCTDRGVANSSKHIQNRFVTQNSSAEYSVGGCLFTGNLNLFPGTDLCPNLEAFKGWIDANPTEVVYALDTPIDEPLTEEQKKKLLQIRTYSGGTIFEFGNLAPFYAINYWLGNSNGQALADMDAKINQLLIR